MKPFDYTPAQLATQRDIAARMRDADYKALANLDAVPADVRENHRRTINMRIAGYTKRIDTLNVAIAEKTGGAVRRSVCPVCRDAACETNGPECGQ